MSLVQRRLGDPPESSRTGVSEQQHRATLGGGNGKRMLSPPSQTPGLPNWGSDLVASLQPHSPQPPGDRANITLRGPAEPPSFWGFEWAKRRRGTGRGEGGRRPLHPRLGKYLPPSPAIAHYQVVPINITHHPVTPIKLHLRAG